MNDAPFPTTPGLHRITLADGQRLSLSLPAAGPTGAPLVLALHWGGQVTPFVGSGIVEALVSPGLHALSAVIAAPDARHGAWQNEDAEGDLVAVLDCLLAAYPVDPARVVVTGYSMGGIGAWYFAARQQARLAAALPLAAPVPPEAQRADWTIPVYTIFSRDDDHFPAAPIAAAVAALRGPITAVQIDGVSHYDAERYAGPLRAAAAWLQRHWSLEENRR